MKKVFTEEFLDINSLLRVINSRQNNCIMKGQCSSKSGSKGFTGSESYEESVQLIRTGYVDILKDVKHLETSFRTQLLDLKTIKVFQGNF